MGEPSRLLKTGEALRRAFAAPEPPAVEPVVEEQQIDPVEQAHARGLAEGREQGQREAAEAFEARAAQLQEQVTAALRHLSELEPELVRRHNELMVELALAAASKIVRARIDADDPLAARALAEAAEVLPVGDPLQARLHPDDVEAVRERLADLIERRRIELHADESVSRGGCVVESPCGTVDASLETAMATVGSAADGRPESR